MNLDQLFSSELPAYLPAALLLLSGCLFIGLGLILSPEPTTLPGKVRDSGWAWASLAILMLVLGVSWFGLGDSSSEGKSLFTGGGLSRQGTLLTLLVGCMVTTISIRMTPQKLGSEFHGCFLILLSGAMLAIQAADLTTLYLGLELVSIPTIVLLAITRADQTGNESALKYFALSACSSAIFLLGCSYLYGIGGTTEITTILNGVAKEPTTLAKVAMALVFAGLAFRMSAVPFHHYAPDVFSGCSVPMMTMLSTLPKIVGMLVMMRLLGGDRPIVELGPVIIKPLVVIAIITMTVGNCSAIAQKSWRRMLAYSSVAHSGYLLLAVAASLQLEPTSDSILFYLVAYCVMTVGLIAGISTTSEDPNADPSLDSFQGLFHRSAWLGMAITVCLLGLIGTPLTAGFWGKYQIFQSAISSGQVWVMFGAILIAFNAAISAIFYLAAILRLFNNSAGSEVRLLTPNRHSISALLCLVCATLVFVWFWFPNWALGNF